MYTSSVRELKKKITAREWSMCDGNKLTRKQLGRFICHSWSQTLLSSCLQDFRFIQISQIMSKWRWWHLTPSFHGKVQACLSLAHVCTEKTRVGEPGSLSSLQSEPWCGQDGGSIQGALQQSPADHLRQKRSTWTIVQLALRSGKVSNPPEISQIMFWSIKTDSFY